MNVDEMLVMAMFSEDSAVAAIAKRLYDKRHVNDPQPQEPEHCSECFEGCPKCQPERFARGKL